MLFPRCAIAGVFALLPLLALSARLDQALNVLGGEDVTGSDLNFVVGIVIKAKNSKAASQCSGSIINSRWILTAGHCLSGKTPSTHNVEVLAGAKRLSEATGIKAEKWILHERFRMTESPTRVFYDIALIKLEENVLRLANTEVASLPSSREDAPRSGRTVTVTGFGVEGEGLLSTTRKGVLKKAEMVVRGICGNTYPYCIKAADLTGRSCPGDSGGPMLYNGVVVGISSTGRTCTTRSGESQYTQVSRYISWIKQKIASG